MADSQEKKNNAAVVCSLCCGTRRYKYRRCSACRGLGVYQKIRGQWQFWGANLSRVDLMFWRWRRWYDKIAIVTFLLLGWFCLGLWIWQLAEQRWPMAIAWFNPVILATQILHNFNALFLIVSMLSFGFCWFKYNASHNQRVPIESHQYSTAIVAPNTDCLASDLPKFGFGKAKKVDISKQFSVDALLMIARSFGWADHYRCATLTPLSLFLVLLKNHQIIQIFLRLGVPVATLYEAALTRLQIERGSVAALRAPTVGAEFYQTLFSAYELAYNNREAQVDAADLLIAVLDNSPVVVDILFDYSINRQKLANVAEWARTGERLRERYHQLRRAARWRPKQGMDRALTALATPFLNQFGEDLTLRAQRGELDWCVARNSEIDSIFNIINGGARSVLLVGDHGVGKKSIIEGVAQLMLIDDVPARLRDKRLVRLSISSLLSGTTAAGAVERLMAIGNEITRARNVVLFIHNVHELAGVSTGGSGGSLDVAGSLSEVLTNDQFFTFATTTADDYARVLMNSPINNVFASVAINEMDENQAIQVLESQVGMVEYKHNVFFAYDALAKIVRWSKRYLTDTSLPGSALEILTEVASYTRAHKGVNTLITIEEVAAVVSQKARVPVATVSADESTKLLQLESILHERIIGQDEAVNLVANALRRARAEIRSTSRPIANFLFLGPTGVGKTELTKTIAEVYYGGEDKIIRLDMSEYQEKSSIGRLIGMPGQKGSGLLTEAVRRRPFSLILLDEVEKADPDVLNIFLQVMDDGRLSDSTGKAYDFTNVILIATSNAATNYVQDQLRLGLSSVAIKERLMHGELRTYFKPEFLNRFDGVVLFHALEKPDIKKIAALLLKRVVKDLGGKGMSLKVSDAALDYLAEIGFDPEFGARPLRRAIAEQVENKLAELILSKQLRRKDKIILGEKCAIQTIR